MKGLKQVTDIQCNAFLHHYFTLMCNWTKGSSDVGAMHWYQPLVLALFVTLVLALF